MVMIMLASGYSQTLFLDRYIIHLLDEKLDSNKPSRPYLLCPKTLEKVNSQPIAYFINKVLNVLYPIQQMTKMFFCADMLHHTRICLLFMLMG